jgi:hypothetical protein
MDSVNPRRYPNLGGNNIEAVVGRIPATNDPDKTKNYEVGIKGDLLNGTLGLRAH